VLLIDDSFSKIYKYSRSPFVQAALLDVFTGGIERSVELNREGNKFL
jgi:hypothetical protein